MKKICALFLIFVCVFCSSCARPNQPTNGNDDDKKEETKIETPSSSPNEAYDDSLDIVVNLNDSIVENNNGYVLFADNIVWILGEGIYILTGEWNGQVIISAGDSTVEIDLIDCNITCQEACPFLIYQAGKCEISAKKGSNNAILDLRTTSKDTFNASIYALCDLTIKGSGNLVVQNSFNNGIHTKDDLIIKNLSLNVKAVNNAIKGNDSITIESGTIKAVSTKGDALKTTNSDVSSKGKQRGTITINGGILDLYAACDTIDASYDVVINNDPIINCYTESFSEYSEEVSFVSKNVLYLEISQNMAQYRYALLYYFIDETSSFFDATVVSGGMDPRRKYLSVDLPENVINLQVYIYDSSSTSTSTTNYIFASEKISVNNDYDCLGIRSINGDLTLYWTTYQVMQNGPGGMNEGNPNKASYSCKGIKADNEITINGGQINIKSHDDAIHVSGDNSLENGKTGLGNIIINDAIISIYTNDDGIHADNNLHIKGGKINISHSYEGLEANIITLDGGCVELVSSDDGLNATTFSKTPCIYINGGILYLDAGGDGLDSNGNIVMTGGYVVAVGPSNRGNGVLDYDKTFKATGGYLLAIGCNGMNQSVSASGAAHSSTKTISTSTSSYVTLEVDGVKMLILKVTKSNMNYCVYSYVGSNATVSVSASTSIELENGLYYVNLG